MPKNDLNKRFQNSFRVILISRSNQKRFYLIAEKIWLKFQVIFIVQATRT